MDAQAACARLQRPKASGIKAARPRFGTKRGARPASPTVVRRDAIVFSLATVKITLRSAAVQISAPVKLTTHAEFRAMKKLRHVNAIAENQPPASRLRGQCVQIWPVHLECVGKWVMRGARQTDLRAC